MSRSIEYIVRRLQNTRAAQDSVKGSWVWNKKSVEQWDADIADLKTLEEKSNQSESTMRSKRGLLDGDLDEVHVLTVQGITFAKVEFRDSAETAPLLSNLSAEGGARANVIHEAQKWLAVWNQLPETWSPTPSHTKAAFTKLLQACETELQDYNDAYSAWRVAREEFNHKAARLADDCVAWYKAATTLFSEDTPEGRMVRGVIPMVESAGEPPAPPPPKDPDAPPQPPK